MMIQRFPVEASHIMMFARAVGDPNPAFADPESPQAEAVGGVVAPPTFVMAGSQFDPDNPLRPTPGKPWFGSGREPSGAELHGGGMLHAEQVFEYHRPVRVGTVLTAAHRAGETWQKQSKRGGLLRFSETILEFRDEYTGELFVTVKTVAVQTEKPVEARS